MLCAAQTTTKTPSRPRKIPCPQHPLIHFSRERKSFSISSCSGSLCIIYLSLIAHNSATSMSTQSPAQAAVLSDSEARNALDLGIKRVTEATALDTAGRWPEAVIAYTEALLQLDSASLGLSDANLRAITAGKVIEYRRRMIFLQSAIAQQAAAAAAASTPSIPTSNPDVSQRKLGDAISHLLDSSPQIQV